MRAAALKNVYLFTSVQSIIMTNDPVEFIDLKHGGVLVEKLIKSSYETFDLHFVGKLVHLDGHVHILEIFLSAVNVSKNYFNQKVYSSKSM